jgi:hypothetical protein
MKALGEKTLMAIFMLGLGLRGAPAWAQRPCLPFERINPPADSPYVTCTVTTEFVRPVDLDGDGGADFTHERYRSIHRYEQPAIEVPGLSLPYTLHHQDDTIEAYYPAEQVEMYWLVWRPTHDKPELRLPAGHELRPEPVVTVPGPYGSWGLPEPARSWVYPHFEAQGLGIFYRQLQYTCETPVPPFFCARNYYGGYLAPWEEAPWTVVRQDYDQYFGFRVRRGDGWHLGWVQLRWQYERGGLRPDPVALVAWAVHPEPEAPIVVGEPARPTLQCERGADGGLVVKWSAVWTNAVLERSPSLSAPAWVAVSGVQPQGVRLSASEAQGFFRLRVP